MIFGLLFIFGFFIAQPRANTPWEHISAEELLAFSKSSDLLQFSNPSEIYAQAPKRRVPGGTTVRGTTGRGTGNKPRVKTSGDPYAVRLNWGMGPSLNFFPGVLWDAQSFYTGWAIDIHIAISRDIMSANRRSADSRFRNYIDGNSGAELRPSFIALFPTNIFFSPGINGVGIYGINWHFAGFMGSTQPIPEVGLSAGVKVPAMTLLYISTEEEILNDSHWILGVGASLMAKATLKVSSRVHTSAEWSSTFYLPMAQMKLQLANGGSENLGHIGTLALLFHYRFGLIQDL